MNLIQQFASIVLAPASVRRLTGRCWALLVAYLIAAGLLLGLVAALLIANQEQLRQAIVGYILPEGWQFAADLLIDYFLRSQTKAVLINAAASGSLLLVSLVLFPLKEKLSATFEAEAELTDRPALEFPLWYQGLEEIKLVILYATVFMVIFWVGYHPDPTRKLVATILSYVFLFFQFAIDFIAPTLQRHKLRYSQVIKTLLKHPIASFSFGALFAMPAVLVGLLIKANPAMSMTSAVLLLFGANVIAIIWAAVAGTWLGAKLIEDAEQTRPSRGPLALLAWAVLLATFALNSYLFISLGQALHHKSQLLKCNYSVDFSSLGFHLPKSSGSGWKGVLKSALGAVLSGKVEVGAYMTVTIRNPTRFDVEIEKNRIDVKHEETVVANTWLSPVKVPAGETVSHKLDFKIRIDPRVALKGRELLENKWRITLYLQIDPNFEFPVYLLSPDGKKSGEKKGSEKS